MSTITKPEYDSARKSITEHGNRMKSRMEAFFLCEQYWIQTCDPKCGGKDVASWESSAIYDSGENQSAFRLYARCGYLLDCVKELAGVDAKAVQAFGRLIEFSTKNGFSWKNAADQDAVRAFAAGEEKNQDAARKEADRLQPTNKKRSAESSSESPATISDASLASMLSLAPLETLERALGIISQERATSILRSLVGVIGEEEVVEIISPSPSYSESIDESRLVGV